MNQSKISEGNELIAKFMGEKQMIGYWYIPSMGEWKPIPYTYESETAEHFNTEELKYHSDWKWVMPVWDKLISSEIPNQIVLDTVEIGRYSIYLSIFYYENGAWFTKTITHSCYPPGGGTEHTNMNEVYWQTIIEFINFYNQKISYE